MPAKSHTKRKTTRKTKRTTKSRARSTRVRHRQADLWTESGPEAGTYPTGGYVGAGPSGYGLKSAIASIFQGRSQVSPYGLRSSAPPPAAVGAAAPAADASTAAATSGDAVAQQRHLRVAMQRVLRELK